MSPHDLALRFLTKGEQDLAAARVLSANPDMAHDIVGFHCQQAVEKFLKAVLVKNDVVFRKTHDLIELMQVLEDHDIPLPENHEALDELEPYAVTARYDFFDEPVHFDRKAALQTATSVREWAGQLLQQGGGCDL